MFPTIVPSRSNNIFAGQRATGKRTYFQDVSPSFNYKCSQRWHSCNWGADLHQIISTDVRGCSPRGGEGQAEAAAWRHVAAAFLRSTRGPGGKDKGEGEGWLRRAAPLGTRSLWEVSVSELQCPDTSDTEFGED